MKQMVLMLALALAGANVSAEEAPPPEQPRPALMAAKAVQARLLDIAAAGSRLVAVGEEGVILKSADGSSWQQVPSPVSTMLTRVHFTDASNGWILGYGASILQTRDGGQTWVLRHYEPKGRALYDLQFLDAQHGIAVGGFGRVLETRDGGQTWSPQDSALSQLGVHLYVLLKLSDGSLFVAGERGLMARSLDAGTRWQALDSPYAGSFFGALPQADKGMLVYGMRGNVFSAADLEACATTDIAKWDPDTRQTATAPAQIAALGWRKIDNASHESLFGSMPLRGGAWLLIGSNGTALKLDAANQTLSPVKTPAVETLVKAIGFNGRMIAVGRRGIQDIGALP